MALQGPIPVEFGVVFPSGAYAAGAFEPVRNFEASTGEKFVQSADKATGTPLWVIEVLAADPAARVRAVKVKVAAPEQPVVPAAPPAPPRRGGGPRHARRPVAARPAGGGRDGRSGRRGENPGGRAHQQRGERR